MRRGFAVFFAFVFAPSILAACEPDAGSSGIEGGALTEAGAGLSPQSPPGPPYNYGPVTPGNTWTALYTDYFGPPRPVDGGQTGGRASCAGDGACHGSATTLGTEETGFLCPDKDTCYQSLTCQNSDAGPACPAMLFQALIVSGQPFTSDYLYTTALRSADNLGGQMPLRPPPGYPGVYTFTDLDIQRLTAWVDAGFPNN